MYIDEGLADEHGHINAITIARFRQGSYDSQSDSVKQGWLFCMIQLLPHINPEWGRKNVKASKLLSDEGATTHANEAILFWILEVYLEKHWLEEFKEEDDWATNHSGAPFPRRKKKGLTYSMTKAELFCKKNKEIKMSRRDAVTGTGWDMAVRDEVRRLAALKNGSSTEQDGISEGNAKPAKRQKYIIYYGSETETAEI